MQNPSGETRTENFILSVMKKSLFQTVFLKKRTELGSTWAFFTEFHLKFSLADDILYTVYSNFCRLIYPGLIVLKERGIFWIRMNCANIT